MRCPITKAFTLGARNKFFVVLVLALKFQKVVIAADLAIGILPADAGPGLIDRAAALVLIKKLADGGVDMVFSVFQNVFDFAFVFAIFNDIAANEFFPGGCFGDAKMIRKPTHIFFGYRDAGIAAAVSGAFTAVIFHFGHGTIPSHKLMGIV